MRQSRTATRACLLATMLAAAALTAALGGLNAPLLAQTTTTVADTIHAPDGSLPSGKIVISSRSTFTAADGAVVLQGTVATETVTNGAFSVALIPNAGSTPAGTSYTAIYELSGVPYRNETWVVPASATPVNLAAVRSATLSQPSELVSASQLPALTGDVSSSAGSADVTVKDVNGVAYPANPPIDTLPLITASDQASYTALPSCGDTGGNHLNYDSSTHTFSCGSSGATSLALPGGGEITGSTGDVNIAAGGTNQSINLTPSGTGVFVVHNGNVNSWSGPYAGDVFDIYTGQNYVNIDSFSPGEWGLHFRGLASGGGPENIFEMVGNGSSGKISLGSTKSTYWLDLRSGNQDVLSFNTSGYGTFYRAFAQAYQQVGFQSAPAWDVSQVNVIEVPLSGNITSFSLINAQAGQKLTFIWVQDSAGGHTVSGAPANMYGFTAPGTTADTRSIQTCMYDGTDWACGPAATNLTHP